VLDAVRDAVLAAVGAGVPTTICVSVTVVYLGWAVTRVVTCVDTCVVMASDVLVVTCVTVWETVSPGTVVVAVCVRMTREMLVMMRVVVDVDTLVSVMSLEAVVVK